jgi:uncharacterized protein
MDSAGIDVQVLSAVSHWVQQLAPDAATSISRQLNERMAAAVVAHPDRFRALAALPTTDPVAAAKELARTVEEDGFVGAMIHGHTRGTFLDDEAFHPVLGEAERLGVPIYVHPSAPPAAVQSAYYQGLSPALGINLATAGWGWHVECGLHILRLAVSGTLERFPGLQLIVGHMGENLPFSLVRADGVLTPYADGLSARVGDIIREHLYITTCGYHTDPPLLCTAMVFGVDKILFSVDYPFGDSAKATEFLSNAPLSPADKDKIACANAERLLRI